MKTLYFMQKISQGWLLLCSDREYIERIELAITYFERSVADGVPDWLDNDVHKLTLRLDEVIKKFKLSKKTKEDCLTVFNIYVDLYEATEHSYNKQ